MTEDEEIYFAHLIESNLPSAIKIRDPFDDESLESVLKSLNHRKSIKRSTYSRRKGKYKSRSLLYRIPLDEKW